MSARSSRNSSLGRKPPHPPSRSLPGLEIVVPPRNHPARGSSSTRSSKFNHVVPPRSHSASGSSTRPSMADHNKPLPALPHSPYSVNGASEGQSSANNSYKYAPGIDAVLPIVQLYPGAKDALSPDSRSIPVALDLDKTSIHPRLSAGVRAHTSPTVRSSHSCNSQLSTARTHCYEDDNPLLAAKRRSRDHWPMSEQAGCEHDLDQLGSFSWRSTSNSPSSSHTMVDVDPRLLPPPLATKGLHRGKNASETSLFRAVEASNADVGTTRTPDPHHYRTPPPIPNQVKISEEATRQRLYQNQHIPRTASAITLPSSSLSKEYLPEKDGHPNNNSFGNRTLQWSSDSSLLDLPHLPHPVDKVDDETDHTSSDKNNHSNVNTPTASKNPSFPHRRLTQPAIPLSEHHKYRQSVQSSPKQKQKRRWLPQFIHKLLPQQIEKKVTTPQIPPRPPPKKTSTARSITTSARSSSRHKHHTPRRRRPLTPSPAHVNRNRLGGKGTAELGMTHTCRSMLSLTRDKFKMPGIEWRKGNRLKSHTYRAPKQPEKTVRW